MVLSAARTLFTLPTVPGSPSNAWRAMTSVETVPLWHGHTWMIVIVEAAERLRVARKRSVHASC